MVEFGAGDAAELAASVGFWQAGAQGAREESDVERYVVLLLDRVIAFAERHELYALRTIQEQRKAIMNGARQGALSHALQESSALFSRALKDSSVWRMTRAETLLTPIEVPETLGQRLVMMAERPCSAMPQADTPLPDSTRYDSLNASHAP
jgi:hypothetical protein